jgi:hypothetical protein
VPTTTKDSRIPILSAAPDAFFFTGDADLKQTSAATFAPWVASTVRTQPSTRIGPVRPSRPVLTSPQPMRPTGHPRDHGADARRGAAW